MADEYQMPTGTLMKGKKGVITGVANHQSIAWGIASQLAAHGAELAFLHLPGMERRVEPLAQSVGAKLIAPVTVGKGAYVAAGSSITEDVPARSLAIGRGKQVNKEGWVDRKKS